VEKAYILFGGWRYEGNATLGVYSSREKAEKAEEKVKKIRKEKGFFPYDYYSIAEIDINEEPMV